MHGTYTRRLDALEQTWEAWAEVGGDLTVEQWSAVTRCEGWDVAALYAHHAAFPVVLSEGLAQETAQANEALTAVRILGGFNSAGGIAETRAERVAEQAISQAALRPTEELVRCFSVDGSRAIGRLRRDDPTSVVLWPASAQPITLIEALRIVLMEATVHLLDLRRALGQSPDVPENALQETRQLLVELAPVVDLVEAASGRTTARPPLPVLR